MTISGTAALCSILKLLPLPLIIMPSMGIANKYLKKEPNQDPFRLYTVEEQIVG